MKRNCVIYVLLIVVISAPTLVIAEQKKQFIPAINLLLSGETYLPVKLQQESFSTETTITNQGSTVLLDSSSFDKNISFKYDGALSSSNALNIDYFQNNGVVYLKLSRSNGKYRSKYISIDMQKIPESIVLPSPLTKSVDYYSTDSLQLPPKDIVPAIGAAIIIGQKAIALSMTAWSLMELAENAEKFADLTIKNVKFDGHNVITFKGTLRDAAKYIVSGTELTSGMIGAGASIKKLSQTMHQIKMNKASTYELLGLTTPQIEEKIKEKIKSKLKEVGIGAVSDSTVIEIQLTISIDNPLFIVKLPNKNNSNLKSTAPQNINEVITVDMEPNLQSACGEVVSSTGRIWQACNQGASNIASSHYDSSAYGGLFQWGRAADGHQARNSSITTTVSTTLTPGHNKFIAPDEYKYQWSWVKDNLLSNEMIWNGTNGINNPCSPGFRVPTSTEWAAEANSWDTSTKKTFYSSLKLTTAGERTYYGISSSWPTSPHSESKSGYYWTSSHYRNDSNEDPCYFSFSRTETDGIFHIHFNCNYHVHARSVRCIKD